MKKLKTLLVFVLIILCCACNSSTLTSVEFKKKFSDNDFYVVSTINHFENYEYIKESFIATSHDKDYSIEFYILSSEDAADEFFNANKDLFEAERTEDCIYKDKKNKYSLTTDTEYKALSKRENTVIYVNVKKEYKNEVNKLIKKIGY